MARTVVDLSRNLGLATIAEGIEHEEQAAALRDLGCSLGQGFLYSRPLAADAMTSVLMGAGFPLIVPQSVTARSRS